MAQIKGKFIKLTGFLMSLYKDAQQSANSYLQQELGIDFKDIEDEKFYDTKIWSRFMDEYAQVSVTKDKAYVTLGQKVYPTIKKTTGLPDHLKTPLDYILYEAEGFKLNHRGSDVIQRKILQKQDKHIIMEAPAPGYDCRLYEGVFLGILQMIGVSSGKVIQTKCQQHKGDSTCEFHITWK